MKKKLLSIVLALSMICALVPIMASAETTATSGTCGENVTWTLSDDGTLTISGTGDMEDYSYGNYSPFERNQSIKTVVIENGVTSIGIMMFYYTTSLKSVTIPDSVTSIGNTAFAYCWGLKGITIPDSVKSIGSLAFYDCNDLTNITIPNSVIVIGNSAFENCDNLTNIIISNSVTDIGETAFRNCKKLTDIKLSNSLTSIPKDMFVQCYALTNVTIPNSVTSIGEQAFEYCNSLASIIIPKGVESIGSRAFTGCSSLKEINADLNNQNYSSIDGILFSKDNTTLVRCPEGKKNSYEIPDGVTNIGEQAFYNCTNLTSIEIPNSVTSIGEQAFHNCTGLTSMSITNGVTQIGGNSFAYCENLVSIGIPKSVTSIGAGAFNQCSSLTSVYYGGTKEEWNAIDITWFGNDCLKNATVHYKRDIPLTTAKVTTEKVGEGYTFNVEPATTYEDCYVYAAMYDENGLLTGFERVPLETSGSTTISVNKTDKVESAKVFVLSDMLQPVIQAQEFNIE